MPVISFHRRWALHTGCLLCTLLDLGWPLVQSKRLWWEASSPWVCLHLSSEALPWPLGYRDVMVERPRIATGGSESDRGRGRSEKQGATDEETSRGGGCTDTPAITSQGGHWAQQRRCPLRTRPSHEWAEPWSPSLSYSDGT